LGVGRQNEEEKIVIRGIENAEKESAVIYISKLNNEMALAAAGRPSRPSRTLKYMTMWRNVYFAVAALPPSLSPSLSLSLSLSLSIYL
jgi:hypothetical protein